MKKFLITIYFIAFFIPKESFAQNAFWDAYNLVNITKEDIQAIFDIANDNSKMDSLKLFNLTDRQKEDIQTIIDFMERPFIVDMENISIFENLKLLGKVKTNLLSKDIGQIINVYVNNIEIEIRKLGCDTTGTYLNVRKDSLKELLPLSADSISIIDQIKSIDKLITKNKLDCYKKLEQLESNKKIWDEISSQIGIIKNQNSNFEVYKNTLISSTNWNLFPSENATTEEIDLKVNSSTGFSLNQSALIDATAKVITAQVKENIIYILINNLLNNDYKRIIKSLFPKTIAYIEDRNNYTKKKWSDIDKSFRANLNSDLRNVLNNFSTNIETIDNFLIENKILSKRIKESEYFELLVFTIDFGDKILKGFHPIELFSFTIEKLRNNNALISKKFLDYFTIVNGLQKNFRDYSEINNGHNVWIKLNDYLTFKEKGSGTNTVFDYFLALLYYQNLKDLGVSKNIFNDEKTKNEFLEILISLNELENNINSLRAGSSGNKYEQYLEALISFFEKTAQSVSNLKIIEGSELSPHLGLFKNCLEAYKSISNNEYNNFIPALLNIIDKIIVIQEDENLSNLSGSHNDEIENENKKKVEEIKREYKSRIYSKLIILTNIATAKSQDELENAILSSINYSGGFLRKRENGVNLLLNSYPGINFSNEYTNGKNAFNMGITAPIGLEFAFSPFGENINFGLFLQVFDIGAVFNYRFSDPETDIPTELTFKQVFSPGAYFVVSPFYEYPITFNVGASWTPQLRKIEKNGTLIEEGNSFRWGLNVCYDIPLFYIF